MKLSFSYQITLPKKNQTTTQIDERKWIIKNKQINNNKFKKKKRRPFYHHPLWESERIF